jgi:hypothetical protein
MAGNKHALNGIRRSGRLWQRVHTSNHDRIASGKLVTFKSFALHVVGATGLVPALLSRIEALRLPIQTLVPSGN